MSIWISTAFIVAVRMFCWYKHLNIITYGDAQDPDGTLRS